MSKPSLLVLFVSGWAAAKEGPGNLFARVQPPFLGEYASSYPTMTLAVPAHADLAGRYRAFGLVSKAAERAMTLSPYLAGHGVSQVRIASSDRYGLLTEIMSGQTIASEKEEWLHVPLPPGVSLAKSPSASLALVADAVEEALREKQGRVVFACLDAIWSVGLCRDVRAAMDAISQTDRAARRLIETALRQNERVLVCGDVGMAEAYMSEDGQQVLAEETMNPLPLMYIDASVEGKRAAHTDYAVDGILPLKPSGNISDLACTICALMGIPLPSDAAGKPLFSVR